MSPRQSTNEGFLPLRARFIRFLFGLALLPAVAGAAAALWKGLMTVSAESERFGWDSPLGLFSGGVLFFTLLFTLRVRPTKMYIVAHELTHALFAFLDGAEIGRIKIGRDSGSVMLSRSSTLTLLAPYFFPFYTVAVILFLAIASIFLSLEPVHGVIFALIGVTWGFHLCFTLNTLLVRQTDLTRCGTFFSLVCILLVNIWILCVGLVVAETLSPGVFLHSMVRETCHAYRSVYGFGFGIFSALTSRKGS